MVIALTLILAACVAARLLAEVSFRRYKSKQSPAVRAWIAQTESSPHF